MRMLTKRPGLTPHDERKSRMTKINDVASLTMNDGVAVLMIDSPPVNALGHAVREGLQGGLIEALADDSVQAVVIACAGRTFFAGADISEFGKPLAQPDLNAIFERVEAATKPVVAAIHGTALGGGLELALACHYRIADPKAKIGLPEVSLGLLPGAGGTQRTPRLAGVGKAVDLIVRGNPIGAEEGLEVGLIDTLSKPGQLVPAAVAYARRLVAEGAALRRARDLSPDLTGDAAAAASAEFRARNPRLFKGFKAPGAILQSIEAAATLPFDQGLRREWELFEELLESRESAAQRHLFFAERATAKIPGLAADAKPKPISSVAVIGAGTMGTGIAIAFLNANLPVTLIDLNGEAVARAERTVAKTIIALAEKGRIATDVAERRVAALTTATSLSAAAANDLVVEAVFERLDLKQSVFRELDGIAKPGAILASNTSFLDLDQIAAATSRPEDVVGLHFFAPANIMRLLEVVRGKRTSDAVIATAMSLGRALGKVAVLSGVCDGFIANRLMARRGEAADRLLLEGPLPWDIDEAMTDFGFPMGVFSMLDLVGLDVIGWDRENSASRTVQEVLCESGRWGQKTGAGYYDYDERRRAQPSPLVEEAIKKVRVRAGIQHREYSREELVQQLLDPVVNEGAKLIDEGVALKASDIDMALVTGYGWPVWTGGPMFWGDTVGLAGIVARLQTRRDAGEAITISPYLEKLARSGGSLT